MKKNNVNVTSTTKVSFPKTCKSESISKTINRMPALEEEFKTAFGYDFKPSVLSAIIAECDKEKVEKLFERLKRKYKNSNESCYTNDYFLNIVLTSASARANVVSKSTRLLKSDWKFIDSVMTDNPEDKLVLRGKSNFIFFLAFVIFCKRRKISITKPDTKEFSNPIFHVMGNKKWFKDKFCSMFEQLLAEKDIEITLDLFGGSGVLTGYIQDYCYKNNLTVESRYNDLDKNKINFFRQLTASPQKLEKECRKLLKMYDYHEGNKDTENILKLKEDAESLVNQKGLHGAAAFWYVNTTNKKGAVNDTKRKSLEQFAYASELYKNVIFERSDALYRLNKWLNKEESFSNEKSFIIVDSPYCDTKGYTKKWANEEFDKASQQKLCNKLLNAKATWIYHGRIRASASYIKNEDEQKRADKDTQCLTFFDDNFQNKGVFYFDVPLRDTVERIVSNYPFEGFKPYVEETVSPSVKVKEAEETVPSPVETEEVATVENTVHTESSSAEEVKTDNHEPVIKEKTKKKHKECCIMKFFRKLLRCRE